MKYTGWTTNGKMFDRSYARAKDTPFQVARVMPGLGEAVQLMVVGEKRRAWIPEALAYKGREDKPKGMLVFDLVLVDVQAMPVAPDDVAKAPADAEKTKSGLAYKVLKAGTGTEHPKRSSQVTVHYTGWTTDGKMFDSSVAKGQPATLPARPGHPRLDRGRAVDGRGREDPVLDPAAPGLRRPAGDADGHARVRRRADRDTEIGAGSCASIEYSGHARVRMMKQVFRLAVFVVVASAFASQASAQALPWEGRGFLNVNFGIQVIADDAANTSASFQLYDETGTVTSTQAIDKQAPFLDFGGGFRVAGNFGVGFAYSRLNVTGTAEVVAKVPSPIYYDQPRTATASLNALDHTENAYHFQALWMLPITDKVDVMISGGPSWFSLTQGVVTSPQITEVGPPYTTVNMTVAQSTLTASKMGFNVGADLTFRFANNFGVGGMVRYSTATVTLESTGSDATSDVKVGGFQVGGGIRIRF